MKILFLKSLGPGGHVARRWHLEVLWVQYQCYVCPLYVSPDTCWKGYKIAVFVINFINHLQYHHRRYILQPLLSLSDKYFMLTFS